jgi:hypothetical protein
MAPTHSPLRWTTALFLLVTAGTHVPLVREHLAEAPYVGVLFILLSVVAVALAVAVVLVDTEAVWLVAGGVCLAAVLAFLASRTVGLPQIRDDIGMWTEDPLGIPAVASEALVVGLAWLHLHQRRALASHTTTHRRTV